MGEPLVLTLQSRSGRALSSTEMELHTRTGDSVGGLATVYLDSAESVPATQPLVTDLNGTVVVWGEPGDYASVVTTDTGTVTTPLVLGGGSGGGGGTTKFFVQETDPGGTPPYVWWEIDGDGNLITVWVAK